MTEHWLPAPLEVILRHPPLAAELARRFTSAGLPAPAETVVELTDASYPVLLGGERRPAIRARAFRRPDWDAGEEVAAVNVTVAGVAPGCRLICQPGTAADDFADIDSDRDAQAADIGADSRARLRDGGPWMAIFAAAIGATNVLTDYDLTATLAAIDASGCGPAGRRVLTTVVLRAAYARGMEQLGLSTGKGSLGAWLFNNAYADGFGLGRQRGQTEAAIVNVLAERGIGLTDAQRAMISECDDADRQDGWLARAFTAATAAELLAA